MADAQISFGAYERTGNPDLVAINCYAEQYPGDQGPRIEMRARLGLEAFKTVGAGPLRGIVHKTGLFDDAALIVSGTAVYSLTAAGVATLYGGSLAGDDLVDGDMGQDADLNSVARFATGTALYKVQDGVVTEEDFPSAGGPGAASVCYHRGFWFAIEAGTQQAFYQVPGDSTWAPLSFASAEYSPDPLVCIRSRGDQFLLMGSDTCEAWALTGQASPAIAPYGGLNFDFGCRSAATAVNCKGSLLWVDNECNVRRWDGALAQVISGPGLAELIAAESASDLRAWTFSTDTHRFYPLTLGASSTWVFDLNGSGEQWTTFESPSLTYWRAHLGTTMGDTIVALDNVSTQVYRLDDALMDDAGSDFGVEVSAFIDPQGQAIPCASLAVLCDLGNAPATGQGSAPVIGMKFTDDQAKTFSPWMYRDLGVTGQSLPMPRWDGLGEIPALTGRIIRFRVSDPVGRVFKRVFMNVP
jgi:hypothetical protein